MQEGIPLDSECIGFAHDVEKPQYNAGYGFDNKSDTDNAF